MDPLGGSAINAATVYVYQGSQLQETLTTTTSGVANSTRPYVSGTVLNIKVVEASHVTKWIPVTIPKMSPADSVSLASNYIGLETLTTGTFAIRIVRADTGASVADSTVNMTDYGSTPLNLEITVANSVDNTGYVSSYDPLNNINLNGVLKTGSTTSYLTVQNAGTYAPRGTISNWLLTCNDNLITKHLVGGTYVKPGAQTFTISIYKGSLTSAANQTLTFDLYKYFDSTYFAAQGVGGPEAATMATQVSVEFYTA